MRENYSFMTFVVRRVLKFGKKEKEDLIPFTTFNPSLMDDIALGDVVIVTFNVTGKEWNGKYYSSLTATKVDSEKVRVQSEMDFDDLRPEYMRRKPEKIEKPGEGTPWDEGDDLPF